jgi:hypothetical protein
VAAPCLQRETEAENEQLQAEVTRARGLCVAVNVHVCNREDHRLRPVLQEQLDATLLEMAEQVNCKVSAQHDRAGSRRIPTSCKVATQGWQQEVGRLAGGVGCVLPGAAVPRHVH